MKKNAMLKIAAILMVAVLLTTCAISSTFAKYTTSGEDSVTARVAKFGVTVTTVADGLFATSYDGTVASGDVVVAPGTKTPTDAVIVTGVTGTPEVDVNVSVTGTITLTNWKDEAGNFYCPLVFSNGTDEVDCGEYAGKIDECLEALAGLINVSNNFEAGNNLAEKVADVAITWEWPFDNADGSGKDLNAVNDTYLGDQAAKGNHASVTIAVKTTVTQID